MRKNILIFALITVMLFMSACAVNLPAGANQTAATTPASANTANANSADYAAEITALKARIDALETEITAFGSSSSDGQCSCNTEDILVFVRGYDEAAGTVKFDVVEMLTQADIQRVIEHELDGATLEFNNDYEMFNEHELIQTFKLNEGAKFYLLDENDNYQLKVSDLAGFKAKATDSNKYFLCHITIEAGQVVRVSEQYVP